MAPTIISGKSIYFHGYDLTGRTNAIALDYGKEMLDNTTIDMPARSRTGGITTQKIQVEGLVEIDSTDKALFDNVGVADRLITIGAEGDDPGDITYFMKAIVGDLTAGADVGELFAFSLSAECNTRLIRSTMMLNSKTTPLTATGEGAAMELGAIASEKNMYAALHILNVGSSSPTFDLVLESDTTDDFSGAETTRITFNQITGIGSQLQILAGPITDTWWRPVYTIGGGSPSFKAILVVGIL